MLLEPVEARLPEAPVALKPIVDLLEPGRLEPTRLKEVADWLERYRRFWEASFDRLEEHLRSAEPSGRKDGV